MICLSEQLIQNDEAEHKMENDEHIKVWILVEKCGNWTNFAALSIVDMAPSLNSSMRGLRSSSLPFLLHMSRRHSAAGNCRLASLSIRHSSSSRRPFCSVMYVQLIHSTKPDSVLTTAAVTLQSIRACCVSASLLLDFCHKQILYYKIYDQTFLTKTSKCYINSCIF